jgi:hypothetical protein
VSPSHNPWVTRQWIALGYAFLALAGSALCLEFVGLLFSQDNIPPLTELVVNHVPWQLALGVPAAITLFGLWLIVHFGRRMRRRGA